MDTFIKKMMYYYLCWVKITTSSFGCCGNVSPVTSGSVLNYFSHCYDITCWGQLGKQESALVSTAKDLCSSNNTFNLGIVPLKGTGHLSKINHQFECSFGFRPHWITLFLQVSLISQVSGYLVSNPDLHSSMLRVKYILGTSTLGSESECWWPCHI